ncbi:MAG: 2,4'-dihydroxyacetophenone dioxygenase family protein [Pseudolabrys sp.]
MNRHYHPRQVFAYTISGKWGYLEHDWTATAGDFVYETPGEGHTLVAFEHKDPMKVFFIVSGPLIWLDDEGESAGYFDVFNLHRHVQGVLREGRSRCRLHRKPVPVSTATFSRHRPRMRTIQ